jgi:hypothetical protein
VHQTSASASIDLMEAVMPQCADRSNKSSPIRLLFLQAFLDSDATELILGPDAFEGEHLSLAPAAQSNALPSNVSLHGIAQQLHLHHVHRYAACPAFPATR